MTSIHGKTAGIYTSSRGKMKHSKRKLVRECCTITPKDYAISNTHQPLSHSILKDYPLCGNEIKPSGFELTPLFLKAFIITSELKE